MAPSSSRPISRAPSSSMPASESKRHSAPSLTMGIGRVQPVVPTSTMALSPSIVDLVAVVPGREIERALAAEIALAIGHEDAPPFAQHGRDRLVVVLAHRFGERRRRRIGRREALGLARCCAAAWRGERRQEDGRQEAASEAPRPLIAGLHVHRHDRRRRARRRLGDDNWHGARRNVRGRIRAAPRGHG